MNIKPYCRIPKHCSEKLPQGSCPQLLEDLIDELKGASEIHIAAYLFNNPIYVDFIESISKTGTKVHITSIPIQGYSEKRLKIKGYDVKKSAREMAIQAYGRLAMCKNIQLSIFPHLYTWYGALYADGGASYSFHVKAIYAKFPGQENKCILSSGNFMFTDPPHSDSMIVLVGAKEYERVFEAYFADLESLSIEFSDFQQHYKTYQDEFMYSLDGKEISIVQSHHQNCIFTAPFYTVDGMGSNHFAGNRIIEIISAAQTRVWVCAQHFHDLVSFDPNRKTIIRAIHEKFESCPDIEFRFLKQVPHSSLADKRRAAIAETIFSYVMKAPQRYNRLVHDKFMLVDNTLIFSNANYTSTQFAFGKRKMEFIGFDKKKVREK